MFKLRFKFMILLLSILSFTIFHDSMIWMMDNKIENSTIAHMNSMDTLVENSEINEIHNLLHFIAIVTPPNNQHHQYIASEAPLYTSLYYRLRHDDTSYKPPITS